MRTLAICLFLASCLLWSSHSVKVTESGYSFSLENVKTLKKLMDSDLRLDTRLTYSSSKALCDNPQLPTEFVPVCQTDQAGKIFAALADIISPPDPCEICANAACTGCI